MGLLVFLVTYGNGRVDAFAIRVFDANDLPRREVLDAARAGLFASVPNGATIAVSDRLPFAWESEDDRDARVFFFRGTRKLYHVIPVRAIEAGGAECRERLGSICTPRANDIWYLAIEPRVHPTPLDRLSIALDRWAGSDRQTILGDRGVGFRRYETAAQRKAAWALLRERRRGVVLQIATAPSASLVVRAERRCGPVPVQAMFTDERPRVTWGGGFFPLEEYPRVIMPALQYQIDHYPATVVWRYAAARARLELHLGACAPEALDAEMFVVSASPGRLTIRLGALHRTYLVSALGTLVDLPLPPNAPRHLVLDLSIDAPSAMQISPTPRYERTDQRDIRSRRWSRRWFSHPKSLHGLHDRRRHLSMSGDRSDADDRRGWTALSSIAAMTLILTTIVLLGSWGATSLIAPLHLWAESALVAAICLGAAIRRAAAPRSWRRAAGSILPGVWVALYLAFLAWLVIAGHRWLIVPVALAQTAIASRSLANDERHPLASFVLFVGSLAAWAVKLSRSPSRRSTM